MPEPATYQGGCHCGAVRYEVTTDLARVISCNCSLCGREGALRTFVMADHFRLLAGEDALTDYQFNKHNIHHLFCRTCGIRSFCRGTGADGRAMYGINARCLDGVDLAALPVTSFDGRSR
jgi:hypothetical protein